MSDAKPVHCPYGCSDGRMWVDSLNHELEESLWYFDLKCSECSKVDTYFFRTDELPEIIHNHWRKK